MKPSVLLTLFLSFGFVACGPSKYIMDLEVRKPSNAGVELAGKNISVVYLENKKVNNANFGRGMAEGFAISLEKEYNMEPGEVGIYSISASSGSNYSSRDSMFNILMESGSDVVFLLDTVKLGTLTIGSPARVTSSSSPDSSYLSSCTLPFTMKLYCYDGMNKEDVVKLFAGSSVANPVIYSDGKSSSAALMSKAPAALLEEGIDAGKVISESFASQWKTEQFTLLYFQHQNWYDALEKALNFDWKGAMDIWMQYLDSSDALKVSCAAYNLSVACHILGNDSLALEWLDRSDAINPLPTNDSFRKRIR